MPTTKSSLLAGAIALAVFTVLIGLRFNAKWAGGTGQVEICAATNANNPSDVLRRGQIMSSPVDDYAKYRLCDGTTVYLAENTQVELQAYRNSAANTETQLTLLQGRVIVDGVADVHARNSVVALRGAGCELVHYSWKDELDVTPLAERACILTSSSTALSFLHTTRISTVDDKLITQTSFTPDTSVALPFYTWTDLNFVNLGEPRN